MARRIMLETTGPLGFTTCVALVLLPLVGLCLVGLTVYAANAAWLPCSSVGHLRASLMLTAAAGAGCLGVAVMRAPRARLLGALVGGIGVGAAVWAVTAAIFARC